MLSDQYMPPPPAGDHNLVLLWSPPPSPPPPPSPTLDDIGFRVIELMCLILLLVAFILPPLICYCMSLWSIGTARNDIEQGHPTRRNQLPAARRVAQADQPGLQAVFIYNSQETARATQVKDNNSGTECVICLETFKNGDKCRILSKCTHIYHKHCIDEWLCKSTHCPLCRGSVRPRRLILDEQLEI